MSDLQWYLNGAEPEVVELLKQQWAEAVEREAVHCLCGRPRALEIMFRCLYCGIYFCLNCAEAHFGESRSTYRDKLWIKENDE